MYLFAVGWYEVSIVPNNYTLRHGACDAAKLSPDIVSVRSHGS
jgi:hypothetical protein